ADMPGGFRKYLPDAVEQDPRELRMADERADSEALSFHPDRAEPTQRVDVDQEAGSHEPERHRREQALPARDELRVAPALPEELDGLVDRAGPGVFEARQLHAVSRRSRCTARTARTIGVYPVQRQRFDASARRS